MCRPLHWKGATKLSRAERYFLTQPYVGLMGISDIKQLLADIQNTYIRKGYITTKPYPKPGQNIASGTLIIQVEEGRIAAIVDESGETPMAIRMAFPFMKGKVLNIRDLEQGLDQMNRLVSNRVKLNLVPQDPSNGYGTIVNVIQLTPAQSKQWVSMHVSDTMDALQLYPQRLTIGRDNLLGMNDQWQLSFMQDTGPTQQSNGTWLTMGIPFGYTLGTVSYSKFQYHQLQHGLFRHFNLAGTTERLALAGAQTIHRTQLSKVDGTIQLTQTKTKHTIEDVVNEVGSRTLTVADIGVNATVHGWLGATWFVDLRYHKGLRFWGAPKDDAHLPQAIPRFQFEKPQSLEQC